MHPLKTFFLWSFVPLLLVSQDDLVSDLGCRLDGLTTTDQLVNYVMPGLLDEGFTIAVVDRRWEASRALPAALVFGRLFGQGHLGHQLGPVVG